MVFDLEWAANANWSQRKNDFLVVDSDPDSDAPAVPRDILIRDPDSDGVSFRATLNNQLVLTNGVSLVTINARGGTTKAEVLSASGGPTIITPQPRSTGLLTGGEIVAGGVPASEFTVETGTGVIWDGTTDPATPTLTGTIAWAEFTDETTIGVETFVYITSAGALNLSASRTPALDRSHILLGVVIDSGTSLTIINAPITSNQIGSYVSDLYAEIAIMINDVVITPNASLTVQNSAGTAFGQSINWHTDPTTPNEITISANNPMSMTYVTQDGDFAASTVTNMDVANYNPTGGTISAVGGSVRNATNQRIYITPFGFATLYGQNIFSSLDAAVNGADTENPVVPEWLLNYGTLLVTVSIIRTATDLSNDTEAKFNYATEGGGAGLATEDAVTFVVENTSGATASANEIGYIDEAGEYKTTTTQFDDVAWVVVVQGGANNSDIRVSRRGRVTIELDGNNSVGDFLYTSTTAGRANPQSFTRPELFAVALTANASGAGGTCGALLYCETTARYIALDQDIYSGASLSDSDWSGTIAALPGGAAVRYSTTGGAEDNLKPGNALKKSKMRLFNSTRSTYGLIDDNDPTGGGGFDGEITLTATVDAGWVVGDVITIRSQVNTSTAGAARFADFEITSTDVPALTRSILMAVQVQDSGGSGNSTRFHPWRASVVAERQAVTTQVASVSNGDEFTVPIIQNRFVALWRASGASTLTWNARARMILEATP